MIQIIENDDSTYKLIASSMPNDSHYIGYIHKPFYKYLGICPHRFVRGIDYNPINESGEHQGNILWTDLGRSPINVSEIYQISEGFELTLDEGLRAAKQLAKALYTNRKRV